MRHTCLPLLLPLCVAWLSAACATTQAKSGLAEATALDAPPPPPRVIAPLDAETESPATAAPEEPARPNQPARSTTRPAPARDSATGRGEAPKVDPPKSDAEAPKPVEGPPEAPVHRLQPANEAEQEQSIRGRLAAAERDLSRVDYRQLSTQVKDQYETAKRFIAQAKDALKSRNFVFADSLAEKAAAIASSLKP